MLWFFCSCRFVYQEEMTARIEEINSENSNHARYVGQSVNRIFAQADAILLFMKSSIEANRIVDTAHLELLKAFCDKDVINQIAVADAKGNLVFSAVPLQEPVNIADREHFKVHAENDTGKLSISAPRIMQSTGVETIFVSRRINDVNGNFAGVVSVGLAENLLMKNFTRWTWGPTIQLFS